MNTELFKHSQKYAYHISELCDIFVSVMDTEEKTFVFHYGDFCSDCKYKKCSPINTHLYGSNEAYRWNGKYIYFCPVGLVFIASTILNESYDLVGSLILGPVIMGELKDTLQEPLLSEMETEVRKLRVFPTAKVNHLASLLEVTTAFVSGLPQRKSLSVLYDQDKIFSSMYPSDRMDFNTEPFQHLIQYEKKLQKAIAENNVPEARALLNEMIGNIFFSSNFDLKAIKTRCLELIVLISRSTIDAGADANLVLRSNSHYIDEIDQFASIEELSIWLIDILHRFINIAFDFSYARHSDMVYKTMEYIKSNYNKKLTLDEIANHVFLSRSYISSIFKKETGNSLISYINHVRVEKSKGFLLDRSISLADIAGLCGFDDQSYFSKVFKKVVGVSPKKYRDSSGHV